VFERQVLKIGVIFVVILKFEEPGGHEDSSSESQEVRKRLHNVPRPDIVGAEPHEVEVSDERGQPETHVHLGAESRFGHDLFAEFVELVEAGLGVVELAEELLGVEAVVGLRVGQRLHQVLDDRLDGHLRLVVAHRVEQPGHSLPTAASGSPPRSRRTGAKKTLSPTSSSTAACPAPRSGRSGLGAASGAGRLAPCC
jgi:hypothetical protein